MDGTDGGRRDDARPARSSPPPLTVAASLTAVQGLALVALAVAEIADISPTRRGLGVSTGAFFALYGGGLVAAAWALWRGRAWARGPVLLSSLIGLGIAWNVRATPTPAALLAVASIVVLAGVLHPDSLRALQDEPDPDG